MFTHFNRNIQKLELIPSSGGAFEVTVNGEKVYSKLDTGIFPDTKELIKIVESK
ncbi:Rdx family protein [Neobacillus sp. MM2021_6]|nr:Rdx family protein [Neobacillus sp. MM2021_6]NHC18584.1 SelT/SelW/SelH family protein [Bacillus sp. MM2020_4]